MPSWITLRNTLVYLLTATNKSAILQKCLNWSAGGWCLYRPICKCLSWWIQASNRTSSCPKGTEIEGYREDWGHEKWDRWPTTAQPKLRSALFFESFSKHTVYDSGSFKGEHATDCTVELGVFSEYKCALRRSLTQNMANLLGNFVFRYFGKEFIFLVVSLPF